MQDKSIYSADKISRHPAQLGSACGKLPQAPPVHAQIVLSDLCNHDCHFCAYRQSGYITNQLFSIGELAKVGTNNPNRMIPNQRAIDLIDELNSMGVKAVQLTGGGEPTIHPKFEEVARKIVNHGMDLALVSNGVKLPDSTIDVLSRATWIRISIDATDPETYARVRRVSTTHWDKAWQNIRKLANRRGPVLGVGYVITPENWNGLTEFVRRVRDHGADNIRFSAMHSNDGAEVFKDEEARIRKELDRCKSLGEQIGVDIHDRFDLRMRDMQAELEFDRCGYQHFTTYLGADQNIYRCCNTAYNYVGLLGSFADKPFQQAWAEIHDKMITFDPRKSCQMCQFASQNQTIYELTAPSAHENFV